MIYSLLWLPDVLKSAGCKVAVVDGWQERGHGDVDEILGVLCHHTATQARGNYPTLDTIIHGRSDLKGPLAQLGLGRDGTYYVIAAGKCYHAGKGLWKGVVNGNANFIGIEAENTGGTDDLPWPEVQMEAYRRGVAAILQHIGQPVTYCAGHKEYALPKGRKDDPSFDMIGFRMSVDVILNGTAPPPVLIPAKEPLPVNGAARPTLRRTTDTTPVPIVKMVQQDLGLTADGIFGGATEAAIRQFQREHGLVPDGIIGPRTWQALDQLPRQV